MVLYTFLISLAVYRVVATIKATLVSPTSRWTIPPVFYYSVVTALCLGAAVKVHAPNTWLVTLAASALADGWYLLGRVLYTAGTKNKLDAVRRR